MGESGQKVQTSGYEINYSSVQFSSVAQSCPTLCDPMNRSTPGLPVHHQLLEFTETHVHRVSDAIHVFPFSSCPQSLPASESFPMSQLFAWGGQSTGVSALASFLPKKSQGWSPLEWTGWISLQPKGLSRVFSNTTVQKHQFFGAQPSSQSNSHIHTWPQDGPLMSGKPQLLCCSVLPVLIWKCKVISSIHPGRKPLHSATPGPARWILIILSIRLSSSGNWCFRLP